MAGLGARSVLVTGANRGIGLELVRQLLSSPDPPQHLFVCSRQPDGQRGQAALNMLTKCQSLSYKEDGILCSAVHPGWVKTDMGTQAADLTVDDSVRGILNVLSKLDDRHSGVLVNWKGEKLPW